MNQYRQLDGYRFANGVDPIFDRSNERVYGSPADTNPDFQRWLIQELAVTNTGRRSIPEASSGQISRFPVNDKLTMYIPLKRPDDTFDMMRVNRVDFQGDQVKEYGGFTNYGGEYQLHPKPGEGLIIVFDKSDLEKNRTQQL